MGSGDGCGDASNRISSPRTAGSFRDVERHSITSVWLSHMISIVAAQITKIMKRAIGVQDLVIYLHTRLRLKGKKVI